MGVAVGVPNATPDNDTFCGVFLASSLTVRMPVSLVPLTFFALIGLKVTETSQMPVLAASVPRQFWLAAYFPVVMIWVMLIATGLLLVKVTDIVFELPTLTLPKASA